MKITELMIDNWIQLNNSNYRIKRINKSGHMILWKKGSKSHKKCKFWLFFIKNNKYSFERC